jgi:hypothetical protein
LEGLIRSALEGSKCLIYIASPAAAASEWVRDELRHWCTELNRVNELVVAYAAICFCLGPGWRLTRRSCASARRPQGARNISKGQKAVAYAMLFPEAKRGGDRKSSK